jgi:hypothetical protein
MVFLASALMCYQVISLVRHEYAIDVLNGIPGRLISHATNQVI